MTSWSPQLRLPKLFLLFLAGAAPIVVVVEVVVVVVVVDVVVVVVVAGGQSFALKVAGSARQIVSIPFS
jgi:hypothetical protein